MKSPLPVCKEAKRKIIKHASKEIQMKTIRVRIKNDRRIVNEEEKSLKEKLPIIPNTMKLENVGNGGGENSNVQSMEENTFENSPSQAKETLDGVCVEITDETEKVGKFEDANDDDSDVNKLDIVEIDVDDSLYVESEVSYLFINNSIVILVWL